MVCLTDYDQIQMANGWLHNGFLNVITFVLYFSQSFHHFCNDMFQEILLLHYLFCSFSFLRYLSKNRNYLDSRSLKSNLVIAQVMYRIFETEHFVVCVFLD